MKRNIYLKELISLYYNLVNIRIKGPSMGRKYKELIMNRGGRKRAKSY